MYARVHAATAHPPNTPPTISPSGDYVANANTEVVKSIEHAKRSRKYMCCMLLFFMMLVVGAVLALFVFKKIKV